MQKALTSPKWLGRIVGLVGLLTLVSALSPELRPRLHEVRALLPETFPAAATTGAAATGILLVLLSRALRRGKHRAWLLSTILTAVTVVLHLAKGLDVEEAVITAAMLVLLIAGRKNFTARPSPRSLGRVLFIAVGGPITAAALGWIYLSVDPDGQASTTTALERLQQAVLGLIGVPGPIDFESQRLADRSAVALVVLGAAVLIPLVLALFQPPGGPHALNEEEDARIRDILHKWGRIDSLSYFALRTDRAVIFNKSGKSALTYRVVGNVSLAAGDPLGDPEAWPGAIDEWLAEAHNYGWVPAVLGASEQGARAYRRAGLDALELGDEAIVHVDEFSLDGRSMRGVRQAVSRCRRSGLSVSCHRVRDLDSATCEELVTKADSWRDGEVERGFTMALGRFCDHRDGDSVVVLARDEEGALHGLLNFVPWGADGLSLDLMRRDRETENGVVEFMVAGLWEHCGELGVRQLSLNFAVLRYVFARGEQLGAGPVLRLWRSILLGLSRFWQIESLYRANAKYQPEWRPRFLCFVDVGDLTSVATACLRAEAFIVAPAWVRRLRSRGAMQH